jgi:hypothetical protein
VAELTSQQLDAILAGNPDSLALHFHLVETKIAIAGCATTVHCHCLNVDGNGRVKVKRLAEYLRSMIVNYAIPRQKIEAARARDAKFKSTEAVSDLHYEARSLFTDLRKTGEGGEMLLYLLTQHFLKLPQVLCKMDLKTDSQLHFQGSDGIYAGVGSDGLLKLFWGESKMYADPLSAIRECLQSLAPYLIEEDSENSARERDLVLLGDKADLSDAEITGAFKRYFDKSAPASARVKYCGIALACFDAKEYPADNCACVLDELATSIRPQLEQWKAQIAKHLPINKIESIEIEMLCLPLPSVEAFRKAFLECLGA